MVIDWDDLLSYTTTRSVTVRHRYLGLTYYSSLRSWRDWPIASKPSGGTVLGVCSSSYYR
jgi:hypothetical protein